MSEMIATALSWAWKLVAVAAVVGLFWLISTPSKTSNAVSDLTQLNSNISTMYNAQSTYSSITEAVAYKAAPATMQAGATLVNPWGGAVNVTADTNPQQYDVVYSGVPDNACTGFASSLSGYVSMQIGSATAYTATNKYDAGTGSAACGADGSGLNTFTLIFGK
jgi:hypothetical protein